MNKGTFKKGNKPWNKDKKGWRISPKSEFKKEHTPANFKGIGIPRKLIHSRDGVQIITTIPEKVARVSRGRHYMAKRRTSYARWVMGLPKGMVVYHIDKNPLNNEKSNLIAITRSQLAGLNKGWLSLNDISIDKA